jgi:hypothetical protein
MANRWPIASGNWSNSAIWSGSLIPTASDDVWANNQIVTIDQSINVLTLRNLASSGIAAGGRFDLTNGITVTTTAPSGFVGNTLARITGSDTANIVANNIAGGTGGLAILISDSANLIISGNIIGGSGIAVSGITHASLGKLTITGSVSGGTVSNTAPGIILSSAGSINISGSVSGGTVAACHGINSTSIGTIIVTGSVRAGTTGTNGIISTTNGTIVVYGPISSSISAVGVSSTGTTATNLFTGPFYNTGSFNAVYAYRMQMLSTSSQWRFDTETAGVSKTLYTSNTLPGVPQQTDVRKGTQYNFGLTGSLEMPDPTVVKQGVAVDNTTGSAILTPQDMFDVATQTLTTSGSIGNLLTGASTVQTVGATISSFKV